MHYYQFNIADYRKDTVHLSRLEHSIYRDLIDWYYLDESPIPLETQSVMRRLRLVSEEEAKALENVLSDFFYKADGWRHRRVDQDIIEYHAMAEKNKANGKLGGRPKKTQSVSSGLPNESQNNPNQEPITINQEPLKEKEKEKEVRAPRFDAQAHLVSMGVDAQIASDWLQHRKSKKASVTKTVIDGIIPEAAKARLALSDALSMCCQRGWVGFKAEWMRDQDQVSSKNQPRRPTLHDERAYTSAALTGKIPSSTTFEQFMAGSQQGDCRLIEGEVIHAS